MSVPALELRSPPAALSSSVIYTHFLAQVTWKPMQDLKVSLSNIAQDPLPHLQRDSSPGAIETQPSLSFSKIRGKCWGRGFCESLILTKESSRFGPSFFNFVGVNFAFVLFFFCDTYIYIIDKYTHNIYILYDKYMIYLYTYMIYFYDILYDKTVFV